VKFIVSPKLWQGRTEKFTGVYDYNDFTRCGLFYCNESKTWGWKIEDVLYWKTTK